MKWLLEFFGGKIALGLGKATLMSIINSLIFTVQMLIVSAYIVITLFLFNKSYEILNLVNSNIHSTSSSYSLSSWALKVISSMGIWDAFVDVFSIFAPTIVSLFIIYLSKKSLPILFALRQWGEDVTRIN